MAEVKELEKIAKSLRKDIVEMTNISQSGHPTTSMSCIDILTALYFSELKHNPKNPKDPNRDRFILSKGHGAPAIYVCLAHAGYFPKEELKHLREINHLLQGHPSTSIPGIEIATGSLGMGLSVGNGIAWAAKLDKKDYHTYVMFGDGELHEGQCWESIMATPDFKLDNVTLIVDRNRLQNDGWIDAEKQLEPLDKKFEAFGWEVLTINGHDMKEILDALRHAWKSKNPVCVIANTIKGKGVKIIEDDPDMHGKPLSKEQYAEAIKELAE
ncbi:MAG: transketolase [Candidatus Diapherotrites archaeon CG11_big_fil_rev_8_21_14_0_20_37_9]|nr:MAG: transketolase [Candidatus Diapherotrites archaeon CG11_big_fil_rev_8_21_14_0_20_37_9]